MLLLRSFLGVEIVFLGLGEGMGRVWGYVSLRVVREVTYIGNVSLEFRL